MSYPQALTLHAARTGSLRYGRTTLRLPGPLRAPLVGTLRTGQNTQRNLWPASAVALGMAGTVSMTSTTSTVPLPRRPVDPEAAGRPDIRAGQPGPDVRARHWYENDLGWPSVPGRPLRLLTGVRFDVLDVPAEAGAAALRHLVPDSPVARCDDRMRLLVAAGSAEELPGVLDWLEWGALALDLRALGAGGLMEAPLLPGRACAGKGAEAVQGVAVWLRPPAPGCEVEASLPALPGMGGLQGAPDLVRLVDTVAAQCHRVRLRRASAPSLACRRNQPLAFS